MHVKMVYSDKHIHETKLIYISLLHINVYIYIYIYTYIYSLADAHLSISIHTFKNDRNYTHVFRYLCTYFVYSCYHKQLILDLFTLSYTHLYTHTNMCRKSEVTYSFMNN